MTLPNVDRAIVDLAKLRDYCLNPAHPRGKHKARAFLSALGMTAADADDLRNQLLAGVRSADAAEGEGDAFGQRYTVDIDVTGPTGRALVRSGWIVLSGEDVPRPTTCFVL